ncbi:hypothetical protein [Allocoleopsis sp.]
MALYLLSSCFQQSIRYICGKDLKPDAPFYSALAQEAVEEIT